jgi:hypothetical protein
MTRITEDEWLAELERVTADEEPIPELGRGWWFSEDFMRKTGTPRHRYYRMLQAADRAGVLLRKEAPKIGVHGKRVVVTAFKIKTS